MKRITTILMIVAILFVFVGVANAEVNSVTPSTNDINKTNGWAHVNEISSDVGEVTLEIVSTRNFYSCFEYRTDGDTTQSTGVNYNPGITDGLYPYVCKNNSSSTHTFNANEYVEVRMVFGAETDERFDWTRFDVIPDIESPITTDVVATPNPAAINSSVAVTAKVDDTTTGGSKVASAQYSLEGTSWYPMDAVSSPFDATSEAVTKIFAAPTVPGIYNLCVRGTDAPGNVGDPECVIFVVYDPSGGFVTGGGWIDSPATQTSAGFNTIPDPLAGNYPSQPYQAQQTAEFGDHIRLAGTARRLDSVMITMSSWACESGSWTSKNCVTTPGAGYTHPLTLNIYAVNGSGGTPVTGALLATVTQNTSIPYRPSSDPACTSNGGWGANCFSGYAFNVTFDLSGLSLDLPDEIIYGLAFNTQTWGYDPIGVDGPYTSLNFALVRPGINTWEQVGTDVDPDAVFWNTMTAGYYSDGGAAGVGVFRQDTGWSGYVPAARFYVSTPGAYQADASLGGKTTFGFVSKYKKGATVPDGNTEFQFKAGNLNFSSTNYEWLVINQAGANAQFKGYGTINGAGNYGFMLWAGDGSPDTFRIKIWDAASEAVVYDNGTNQAIGGGSIVVHKK